MLIRAAALGAILAVCAIAGLHWPLESEALNGLALFLALTACVYPGALLAQKARPWVAVAETGVGATVFVCAWIGVAHDPLWIAIGYLVHGVWDWTHHVNRVPMRVAAWFPPLCAAFDVVVAAYAAWLSV
jgi:hypothetical protein